MNRKWLAVWMVLFIFAHIGLTLFVLSLGETNGLARFLSGVLGFPLLRFADEPRFLSFVFANSALWGLVFGVIGVVRTRVR